MGAYITSAQISSVKGGLIIRNFNSGWDDLSITLLYFALLPDVRTTTQWEKGHHRCLQETPPRCNDFSASLKNSTFLTLLQTRSEVGAKDTRTWNWSLFSFSALMRVLRCWFGVIWWLEVNFFLRKLWGSCTNFILIHMKLVEIMFDLPHKWNRSLSHTHIHTWQKPR